MREFVFRMSVKLRMQRIWRKSTQEGSGHWRGFAYCPEKPPFQHRSSVCKGKRSQKFSFSSLNFDQFIYSGCDWSWRFGQFQHSSYFKSLDHDAIVLRSFFEMFLMQCYLFTRYFQQNQISQLREKDFADLPKLEYMWVTDTSIHKGWFLVFY